MTVSDHPELATLQHYLNNTAADEFNGVRLHLAQCAECRSLVDGLTGVQQISRSFSGQSKPDTLTEQQHQKIADYIDGRLNGAEPQQQKEFIQNNATAMKAALNKAALKPIHESTSASGSISGASHPQSVSWKKLKALLGFQTPFWLTVPVTAALVALVSINLVNQPAMEQSPYTIASYQDNAVIQYRPKDQLPGIGFFAKSAQLSEAYDRLKVSVSEDRHFIMQWPPVPGALKYNLRLQMFDQGNKIVVGEVTTENNSAIITANNDNIYHRYEWILSGETSDNRVFFANGGFVINNQEKGIVK